MKPRIEHQKRRQLEQLNRPIIRQEHDDGFEFEVNLESFREGGLSRPREPSRRFMEIFRNRHIPQQPPNPIESSDLEDIHFPNMFAPRRRLN